MEQYWNDIKGMFNYVLGSTRDLDTGAKLIQRFHAGDKPKSLGCK